GDRAFGVRLAAEFWRTWDLEHLPAGLRVVIVSPGNVPEVVEAIASTRRSGRLAVAEVTSPTSARAAIAAGCDALIAAGHEGGGIGSQGWSLLLLHAVVREAAGAVPVWVRGGIGLSSASAAVAAGAAGVVLDGALLLARESPLDPEICQRIAHWDGTETTAWPIGPDASLR